MEYHRVVCLIGTTKPEWKNRYREVLTKLTLKGHLVLTVVWFRDELENFESHRDLLESIHFQKIRMSDLVICIHKKAIGFHTQKEMEYARKIGKPVFFAEDFCKELKELP